MLLIKNLPALGSDEIVQVGACDVLHGRWIGSGVVRFGLAGVVDADDVRELFAFRDPRTGESLRRSQYGRPPRRGFDLTFSAPKSVSLLHALGDGPTRATVVAAHNAAVEDGIAFLEHDATCLQTGAGQHTKSTELTVAAFTQRTNREDEPHLHTQCLVLNRGRTTLADGSDSGWRSLHSPTLYRAAKLAGMVYQGRLRRELATMLGVRFNAVSVNGQADIAGVPRAAIEAFSTRRQQILDSLEEQGLLNSDGLSDIHAREAAAARSVVMRSSGDSPDTPQVLSSLREQRHRWQLVAERVGLSEIASWTGPPAGHLPRVPQKRVVIEWLLDQQEGPFAAGALTRHELMQRLLVEYDLAVSWQQLRRMSNELLADRRVMQALAVARGR